MKNSLNHIILDAPFEDEVVRSIPKKEAETPTENKSEILWEGRPYRKNYFFGKKEVPLSEGEVVFGWVLIVGILAIFLVFVFSNSTLLFLLFGAFLSIPILLYELVAYGINQRYLYRITKTHLIINTPLQTRKTEIPFSKIKEAKVLDENEYETTATVTIYLKNKKEYELERIIKAQKVKKLLNRTISKNRVREASQNK